MEELRLVAPGDLATAATTVQARLGSRFYIELVHEHSGGRVRKQVDLVRLVMPGWRPNDVDLGCVFTRPLTTAELEVLEVSLPSPDEEAPAVVRESLPWAETERTPLDPMLAHEKVERLFDVEAKRSAGPGESEPARPLRAILSSVIHAGLTPLVCSAAALTESTVQVRLAAATVADFWRSETGCLADVAGRLVAGYGEWPDLELTAGTQRVWRGAAHVYGLELCDGPGSDVLLRLAFHRRLGSEELARLLAA